MVRPNFLKTGDSVAIVAPGRKPNKEFIDASVAILESWGLHVILAKNIFSNRHAYLAGTDDERTEDFQAGLDDVTIKAIICARGGYGSTRIIDRLNFSMFQKHPKWIVGFSDITAFHLKISALGFQSIHGTMPVLFSKLDSQLSVESLRNVLTGKDVTLVAPWKKVNRIGKTTATLIGGNLSLIVDSIGTQSDPDTDGKILIIEEIDEYFYKIDRMFVQLERAGKLKNLAGLIIGHFTDIKDTELTFGEPLEEIITRVVAKYRFPVAFGFPTGHENPNLAWRSGSVATLEVDASQSILNSSALT